MAPRPVARMQTLFLKWHSMSKKEASHRLPVKVTQMVLNQEQEITSWNQGIYCEDDKCHSSNNCSIFFSPLMG